VLSSQSAAATSKTDIKQMQTWRCRSRDVCARLAGVFLFKTRCENVNVLYWQTRK